MIAKGAAGHLSHAKLAYIPTSLVDGRDPDPADWYDESSGETKPFEAGTPLSQIPIEVTYDKLLDSFILHNGNHRIKQAELNGETHILAFIEPDGGKFGLTHFRKS